jgi:potassium-dependent mechanosensitive channel
MIKDRLKFVRRYTAKKHFTVLIIFCSLFFGSSLLAQDSIRKMSRPKSDSMLFTDTSTLTQGDYLAALQKVFDIHNRVPVITGNFSNLDEIETALTDDDSAISLIKGRLTNINDRTLNLQNLQTYTRLLGELKENITAYNKDLTKYDGQLDELKKQILNIRKDTVVHHIFTDSVLRASLLPQLKELRGKRTLTDSLVRTATSVINNLKAKVSANSIAIDELLFRINSLIDKAKMNVFSKERHYLFEPRIQKNRTNSYRGVFQKKIETERRIAGYYFKNTRNNRLLVLLIGLVFFCWTFYNYRSIKRLNKLEEVNALNFQYIGPYPLFSSLLLMLSLAPFFDLDAPAIYSELIQILILIVLTIFFIKRLPRNYFYLWCGYFLLFLLLPFFRLMGLPMYLERWWMFFINIAAVIFGLFVVIRKWKTSQRFKHLLWAGLLYVLLNVLAIVCNLFGRVTLTNIFHITAAYAFAQAVSLTILVKIAAEAFLLQIKGSRIRKRYPENFETAPIVKGITKIASVFAIILWLVVFLDNLNVDDLIIDGVMDMLVKVRTIGSFSFTIGGILLFLGIIWTANFLQKYIGYFFGDTGDEILSENKTQRSRLLITRLILLIAGFLLAVAASGLPIDRITIILGALSVGIGLGLQSIVNNFVSGVILIFDRTIRIGDIVEVGDKKGRVKEIGIRTSTLLTDDGAEIIIPNGAVISNNVINWTLSNNHVRINMSFTISKPYDIDKITEICSNEIMLNKNVLKEKESEIFITAITATSATVKICFWCKSIARTEITYSEVYSAIYNRLEANDVKLL